MTRKSLISQFQEMQLFLNRTLTIFLVMAPILQISGQSKIDDLELIKNSLVEKSSIGEDHKHHTTFLLSDHPSNFIKYNPASLVLGGMMWTYQKIISPQISSNCLYSPSCSAYSKNLISDFGIIPGIILTADRLSRCSRLALIDFNSWDITTLNGKIIESTSYYKLHE